MMVIQQQQIVQLQSFSIKLLTKLMSQKQLKDRSLQFTRKKIQSYSYGLNDQIGKGYSSKVYRGRHDDTNQSVAVKVIDLKLLKNQINRTLLDSQIQILKQLKNIPNILSLHDVFTTKNNTYIITELCHTDLSKKVKSHLSELEVYHHMQQLIKGYLEFQTQNIIHRDLKPANLLLTEDNMLKIADFGFGIKADKLVKSSKYNVGSPLYMAPQSLRKNQYSFKTDIWAIGVIFYEMLMMDTPWRAKNQKDLLRKIQTEPIHVIIANKNISSLSKQFLARTLKLDKANRMGPEELKHFKFECAGLNVLGEKIMNGTLKSALKPQLLTLNSPKCLPRGQIEVSLQKAAMNHSKYKSNNLVLQNNESIHIKQVQNFKDMEYVSQTFRKEHVQQKSGKNQTASRENRKLVSKILISQVHFCRFLFKLMQKIKQSLKIGIINQIKDDVVDGLFRNYAGIIKHKIECLNSFRSANYIKCQGYKDYKQTSDCEKLMKIGKQYSDRYKIQIQKYWSQGYNLSSQPTNTMITHLYEALFKAVSQMENPQEQITMLSKDIVILDYLVTSHQLIEMIKHNPQGYERFAKKSRIEEIVEGKTVEIHLQLYQQIMQRVRQIMEKGRFVSFGGDLGQENLLVV